MKRFICICLSVALLFATISCVTELTGLLTHNNVSKIIKDYDKYSEKLYATGLNTIIEPSNTKTGDYLNNDGNVLTIISSDKTEYMFYKINSSNDSYPNLMGDVCTIHLTTGEEFQHIFVIGEGFKNIWVSCDIDICIEFRNKETHVGIRYKSDDYTKSGIAFFTYDDGNFTPDLTDEPERVQKGDNRIKSWISAENLTEHYNQACEYYDILCSVIKD